MTKEHSEPRQCQYDTGRWTPQAGKYPTEYWRRPEARGATTGAYDMAELKPKEYLADDVPEGKVWCCKDVRPLIYGMSDVWTKANLMPEQKCQGFRHSGRKSNNWNGQEWVTSHQKRIRSSIADKKIRKEKGPAFIINKSCQGSGKTRGEIQQILKVLENR